LHEEKPLKFASCNSALERLTRACAAVALLAASASLAQATPATAARTRPVPAQQKPRAASPRQNVRPPPARQPNATRPPTAPSTPGVKPPQTAKPPFEEALPSPQAPPPVDTTRPPPSLPRAPRQKMRACAEEWQLIKGESKGSLPMWRDFATECLTR